MAVNDKNITEKVRKAAEYFADLEKKAANQGMDFCSNNIKINDDKIGEMIVTAAYAASIFEETVRFSICNTLRENKIQVDHNVETGWSSIQVREMCHLLAENQRKFTRYHMECARDVCRALLSYVQLLEADPKKRCYARA